MFCLFSPRMYIGHQMTIRYLMSGFKSSIRLIGIPFFLGAVSLLLVGCAGSKESVPQHAQPPLAQPDSGDTHSSKSPDGTRITIGSSGGVTGGGGGFEIRAEGVINEYSYSLHQKNTILRSVEISPAATDSIFSAFRLSPVFRDSSNLPSNMTSFIGYRSVDTSRNWSWPMGDTSTVVTAQLQAQTI